jgi:hypothetical protein
LSELLGMQNMLWNECCRPRGWVRLRCRQQPRLFIFQRGWPTAVSPSSPRPAAWFHRSTNFRTASRLFNGVCQPQLGEGKEAHSRTRVMMKGCTWSASMLLTYVHDRIRNFLCCTRLSQDVSRSGLVEPCADVERKNLQRCTCYNLASGR